jgi:hypothetical protein
MKIFTKIISTVFMFFIATSFIVAQDTPELKWKIGGTVQAMASYAQTGAETAQTGFGLRRVRLKTYFGYGNVTAFIQYSAKSNKVLDARMTYKFSDAFNLRVGRFIGAGIRAGGLTPHTVIDIVERPMSAQMWASQTVGGDFRDYGAAAIGKFGDLSYNLTLHNGNGAMNLTPSHKSQANTLNGAAAVSGMVSFKPKSVKGLETGAYYGMGNSDVNDYASYNAYVYWEPKPIRIKAEVIGLSNKNGANDLNSLGYYVFGAYGFMDNWEALARFETYDPNTDVDDDATNLITIGARYALFPGKVTASKITFAYVLHGEQGTEIDNDVFYVMFQTAF